MKDPTFPKVDSSGSAFTRCPAKKQTVKQEKILTERRYPPTDSKKVLVIVILVKSPYRKKQKPRIGRSPKSVPVEVRQQSDDRNNLEPEKAEVKKLFVQCIWLGLKKFLALVKAWLLMFST